MTHRPPALPTALWGHAALPPGPCVVLVPARLVSFRSDTLPVASPVAQRAAARLRAERLFQAMGPVAVEAVFGPVKEGRRPVLYAALPRPMIEEVRAAAQAAGATVSAVRIAEFQENIPSGGVVKLAGYATWIVADAGWPSQVVPLGFEADHAPLLRRERLRLGIGDGQSEQRLLPSAAGLDFLAPSLFAAVPWHAQRRWRISLFAAAAALGLAVSGWLWVESVKSRHAELEAQWRELEPKAALISDQQNDHRMLSGWFDGRTNPHADLAVLTQAMGGENEPLRLVRVHQEIGGRTVAAGEAADRATLMDFLDRLRALAPDAKLRSSRSNAASGEKVVFEVDFSLPKTSGKPAAPMAAPVPATETAQKGGAQ